MNLDDLKTVPYFLSRWESRVKENPDKVLLVDGATGETVTRETVQHLSGCVYAYLKNKGIGREDFVMIVMPRGIYGIICMLGVWKAGAAFTIVEDDYAPERIAYIRKDLNCKEYIDFDKWKEIIKLEPKDGYEEAADNDAAFAVYTSGTTGFPKGVLHEYGTIKLNALSGRAKTGRRVTEDSNYSIISPLNFVASIKIVLSLLVIGFTGHILPYEIIKNPKKLKQYFLDEKINISFLSPSILRIIGTELGPDMEHVFTGSEPANRLSLDGIELINTYSMSEAAFTLAQFVIDHPYETAPVGKPNYDGIRLMILDEKDGKEMPEGEIGEIAFENPFFRGYINLPEETKKVLRNGIYHTGDLGKKMPDGNLILCGRATDMIKINGNRIEPAEIEKAFTDITKASWCCAKGFEEPGQSFICLYYKDDISVDEKEIREQMTRTLPYYMIPAYYMQVEEIPLLPNGKINKKILPSPKKQSYKFEYVAPRDQLEKHLVECMEAVLKREKIGIKDDFYQMGGDSLTAMALIAQADLSGLTASDIFSGGNVEKIAEIYRRKTADVGKISAKEYEMNARKGVYSPLMPQVSFMDLQCYSPKHPIFNIPMGYTFENKDLAERIASALNKVLEECPIFSTVFDFDDDCNFVEYIDKDVLKKVAVQYISEEEFLKKKKEFFSYFHKILKAPLYRCAVYVTEKKGYLLLLFHHILIDGMGVQVFMQRLKAAFEGKELPLDTFYSCLARNAEEKTTREYQKAKETLNSMYNHIDWSRNFEGDLGDGDNVQGILQLPLLISLEEMQELENRTGNTREEFMKICLLLAMAKVNHKMNVMMSSASHNRFNPAAVNALGMVLKKVPTAYEFDHYANMAEVFKAARQKSVDAIKYSAYDWIVENENPFDTDFISMAYETTSITSGTSSDGMGLVSFPCTNEDGFAAIRMFWQIMETGKGITSFLIYSKKFYSQDRIKLCSDTLNEIITELIHTEDLSSLNIKEFLKEKKNV